MADHVSSSDRTTPDDGVPGSVHRAARPGEDPGAAVEQPSSEPAPTADLIALVSRRVAEGALPRFVAHDEPLSTSDSGWQLLSGDESEAERDDPSAIDVVSLGELVGRWPELESVFRTPGDVAEWAWDDLQARYVPYRREA